MSKYIHLNLRNTLGVWDKNVRYAQKYTPKNNIIFSLRYETYILLARHKDRINVNAKI